MDKPQKNSFTITKSEMGEKPLDAGFLEENRKTAPTTMATNAAAKPMRT